MSNSVAAKEAFELLNAATKQEYRGWGDTQTAARDRAAEKAGVTPAQAERLWKNWRTMRFPNGDVYRGLRNTYGHLCTWIENAADAIEAKRLEIEEPHASVERTKTAHQRGGETGVVTHQADR
ncbi:hypothetical protein ACFPLB_04175 [Aquamicrobium segne]|uniref:Uncharacterized protein n=1 Tax=Aquamicrobium segne TaxID=469547 RepID=A0ABW0GU31_9HYPH